MNPTRIEWTQNPDGTPGFTWNPITGCLNHVNGMCKGGGFPCYAYRLANGRLKQRYLAHKNVAPRTIRFRTLPNDPFYPRWWPERLYDVPDMEHAKPKGVFVCDMGELFGDWIPEEWVKLIMTRIGFWCKQHRFYTLTKQPHNLPKWSPFPENCWVGVTATNILAYQAARNILPDIEAKVRFISFEPLLERVIMTDTAYLTPLSRHFCDWVIIGAQTKPLKRPHPDWVREITEAAIKAGIAVFHKNNLKETGFLKTILNDGQFKEVYGVDFKQEMPNG